MLRPAYRHEAWIWPVLPLLTPGGTARASVLLAREGWAAWPPVALLERRLPARRH